MVADRERDLPTNKESVQHTIHEAENEPRTEVIVKPPADIKYTSV